MNTKRRNIFTERKRPNLDIKTQRHLSDFTQNLDTMTNFYRKASVMIAFRQMEQELQETSQPSPPHNLRTEFIKQLKSGFLYILEKLFPDKEPFEQQPSNPIDTEVINIIPQENQKANKRSSNNETTYQAQ
jgi:hypothetical protein